MTTTHTFQGLNPDGKTSSRVLNPPGGSSSNIFGAPEKQTQHAAPAGNIPDKANRGSSDMHGQGQNATGGPPSKFRPAKSAFNPITGEPYEQTKSKQEPQPAVPLANISSKTEMPPTKQSEDTESTSLENSAADEEEAQPADDPAPAPPAANQGSAQPPPQKYQSQSGIFGGGAEDVKEVRSTRVSQPPGGRSTKLW